MKCKFGFKNDLKCFRVLDARWRRCSRKMKKVRAYSAVCKLIIIFSPLSLLFASLHWKGSKRRRWKKNLIWLSKQSVIPPTNERFTTELANKNDIAANIIDWLYSASPYYTKNNERIVYWSRLTFKRIERKLQSSSND